MIRVAIGYFPYNRVPPHYFRGIERSFREASWGAIELPNEKEHTTALRKSALLLYCEGLRLRGGDLIRSPGDTPLASRGESDRADRRGVSCAQRVLDVSTQRSPVADLIDHGRGSEAGGPNTAFRVLLPELAAAAPPTDQALSAIVMEADVTTLSTNGR